MGLTERLQVVATHNEPTNKHVIWLKGNVFKRWNGDGWESIGGEGTGTTNYNTLKNKPIINGRVLEGNVNLEIKGEKGDKGDKGDKGETGPQGPPGKGSSITEEQINDIINLFVLTDLNNDFNNDFAI